MLASVIVVWSLGVLVTATLLIFLHGEYSLACEIDDSDSAYGEAKISLFPLGLYCTYPTESTGLPPRPDGPRPGLFNLVAEIYLIGAPVLVAVVLLRRRPPDSN